MNRSRPATAKRLKEMEERGIPFHPLTKPLEMELEEDAGYEMMMQRRRGRDPEK